MGSQQIKQFQHETAAWKRTLEFLVQETVFLKTRLAEAVKEGPAGRDFLEAAEQYQNDFMKEDETLHRVRHDLDELDNLLAKDFYGDGMIILKDILFRYKKLRREVQKVEREFNRLSIHFNSFLETL